ncbi:MAG: beta-galactosidase [Clostridia bacterium]|nr:beta-galactosidase [Clostridia bacterium]
MNNIPRCEHPRPDLKREKWLSLNGEWAFETDNERTGISRELYKSGSLGGKITLPFCPESALSGVGNTDFISAVWYKRRVTLPVMSEGERVILHIGACDYRTTVYVCGREVGSHKGGYTPFSFDITDYISDGIADITIYAEDDIPTGSQLSGKQSHKKESYNCFYTRTTGIWQTVWLEFVPRAYIKRYNVTSDITNCTATLTVFTEGGEGLCLKARARYEGKEAGSASTTVSGRVATLTLPLTEKHLWEVGEGRLYDLELTLEGEKPDTVQGYFGLREVGLTKDGFTVNGEVVYLRTVLDQGFYPDGIYTAPTEEALIYDIETSMKAGFNGARLHQKVFEPLFLYHADRRGYLLFAETGNWGLDHTDPLNIYNFLPEWIEEMERDMAHPSIIGWCPFNETWDKNGVPQSDSFIEAIYDITHAIDPTRPVIANSGSLQTRNDLYDIHDYQQDPALFAEIFRDADKGIIHDQIERLYPGRQHYTPGTPIFVSEWGGLKWVMEDSAADRSAWGYGKSVESEEEYFARLNGLVDVLLTTPNILGYCYTQLTDVEQEQNGILTYGRVPKFPLEKYATVFGRRQSKG